VEGFTWTFVECGFGSNPDKADAQVFSSLCATLRKIKDETAPGYDDQRMVATAILDGWNSVSAGFFIAVAFDVDDDYDEIRSISSLS